jgi:hypothetical protein
LATGGHWQSFWSRYVPITTKTYDAGEVTERDEDDSAVEEEEVVRKRPLTDDTIKDDM